MWINEYNEEETMQMFKEEGRQEGEGFADGSCLTELEAWMYFLASDRPEDIKRKMYGSGADLASLFVVRTRTPFQDSVFPLQNLSCRKLS